MTVIIHYRWHIKQIRFIHISKRATFKYITIFINSLGTKRAHFLNSVCFHCSIISNWYTIIAVLFDIWALSSHTSSIINRFVWASNAALIILPSLRILASISELIFTNVFYCLSTIYMRIIIASNTEPSQFSNTR